MTLTAPHVRKSESQNNGFSLDFNRLLYGLPPRGIAPRGVASQSPEMLVPAQDTAVFDQTSLPVSELLLLRASWMAAARRAGYSPRTVRARRDVTDKLFWFLERHGYSSCGIPELNAFLDYCRDGHEDEDGRWGAAVKTNVGGRALKPLSETTIAGYQAYLKSFWGWIVKRGILPYSPFCAVETVRRTWPHVVPFTTEQIQALRRAARDSTIPARNEAAVLFLYDSGVRASEFCGLRLRDMDFTDPDSLRFTVRGKGDKDRTLRLGRESTAALWKYFQQEHGLERHYRNRARRERRPVDGDSYVFMTAHHAHYGGPLTRGGLLDLVRELGRAAGITGVRCSPHTFRHSFAINFLRRGGDVFTLKEMLGHESLHTVEIYLKIAQADIDNQHRKYSPGDGLERI